VSVDLARGANAPESPKRTERLEAFTRVCGIHTVDLSVSRQSHTSNRCSAPSGAGTSGRIAPQRTRLGNWRSDDRRLVAYRARAANVPVLFLDPASTSKGCRARGVVDDKNRPNQATSCTALPLWPR
jgi:hypothetical protein